MKDCEKFAALLDAFIDGECSPEEAERVREHLSCCPECRNDLEMALAMRDAFPDVEDTEVPVGFSAGVMAAIRSGGAPQTRRKASRKQVLVSLAACCAIVVLIHFAPFKGFGGSSTAQSGAMQAYMATAGSSDAASGSDSPEDQTTSGMENRSSSSPLEKSVSSEKAADSGSAADSSSGSTEESAPTRKKSASTQKKTPSVTVQEPGITMGVTPPTEASNSATGSSSDAESGTTAAEAPSDTQEITSGIPAGGGGGASDDPINSLTQLPEGIQAVQTIYWKQAVLTVAEAGTALDNYKGTVSYDASTGVTTTVYELEEADFDAIISQLNAADKVVENDPATTVLCCISVSS